MSPRVRLILMLAVVVTLSAVARQLHHQKIPWPDAGTWITTEADTQYHFRRVDRAITEGTVAPADSLLNHPHGSPIPWPPYYTYVATAFTAPGFSAASRKTSVAEYELPHAIASSARPRSMT